jgi:hypothetical protein
MATERLLEREPGDKEFDPTPGDGSAPPVNPPPVRWLSHEGVARWRVVLTGPKGQRLEFGPLRDAILALRERLSPGEWTWQFFGLNDAGDVVGESHPRAFTVRRGLPGFASPDVRKLERAWKGRRPRLFAERIAMLREHLEGEFAAPYQQLQTWCELAERQPRMPEPADYRPLPRDSVGHNEDWHRILSAGKVGSAHAARFALSFLLNGNTRHLGLAKRWAKNLLDWSPWGTTSLAICDEAGMTMLERLSFVYDWLYPHWSDVERERFREVMLIRGEEARERDRRVGFAARPFFNHQCRTLAFTGAAGVAFLGDIPQAAEWLQYVLDVMAVSYPSGSWGSDDGGWSQGLNYWSAYMMRLIHFVAAAQELGIDFAAAPYYRNTGYFAVYHLPPYAPCGGFGDAAYRPPGLNHKLVVGAFGAAARDGYLRAYADAVPATRRRPEETLADSSLVGDARRWDAWDMPEVLELLFTPGPDLEPKDLRELSPARVFPYVGWAAMHSALGDAERDSWLEFKSSPFGSVSHSHTDQNAFNLYACGERLLIDSGYYPWYFSPHDALWTNQSWAHNLVLVDGRGQPPYDWFARGRIAAFSDTPPFAYVRGEAAEAYNRPPHRAALELAERHCPELIERMGPATEVRRASRSVLMIDADRPVYVVLDWLRTADPVRFQWLAHAEEKMELERSGFRVRRGAARLQVKFICPTELSLKQDDRFFVDPEARHDGAPKQWHLTAETAEPAPVARFMTVLLPHCEGQEPPAVEPLVGEAAIGARVGEDLILAPPTGVAGPFSWGEVRADAAAVVLSKGAIFAAEATLLEMGSRTLVEESERNTVSVPEPEADQAR